MQTIKLIEFSFDDKGKKDVKQTLYIEATNIRVLRFSREKDEEAADAIKRNFEGGYAFHFNPNDEGWSIVQLGYFDYKGEYRIMFVYSCCDIYIMSDTGKTIDKIMV